ncbi:AT-rich interactive domain-containing protein 3C-like isoform X4 [Diachasmimorpha longicaudata]|uniref:AT-rich interactive domain-containing protein 3C-like isoform X4 n=1 Tax=Diachasmimorpha longicaudata TaxID=58733 RepID=UPI0030B8EFA4
MEISDEYQDMGNPGGGVAMANMPLAHHRHTPESPMSHQEEDLSDPDLQDEESGEELPQQPLQGNNHSSSDASTGPTGTPTPLTHLNSLMNAHHPHFLSKLKTEPTDMDLLNNKSGLEALQAAIGSGSFNLPFNFPPPAAFLTPQHPNNNPQTPGGGGGGSNNAVTSSASSHSSESSQGSARNVSDAREGTGQSQNSNNSNSHQQTSWSFEEQFKQVRQLYEINDDPKRKEFLDDLFSYMQKRGTPINRLPIMAKSVLDLYELYNLVIARGGLVDVINKKLWQEIIKGLHLPSSITSAAFTLRTQYMKYLYPYECEKRRLSTPAELQAAIDGNRREGRRSSYGAYGGGGGDNMMQRNSHTPSSLALHAGMSPLSLVSAVGGPIPGLAAAELEARMAEYIKLFNKEFRTSGASTPPPIHRQGSASPPSGTPPRDTAMAEMSRLTLWNLYNNNTLYPNMHQPPASPQPSHSPHPQATSPEPQREALDLGLRSSPMSPSPTRHSPQSSGGNMRVKKDSELTGNSGPPPPKRTFPDDDPNVEKNVSVVPSRSHIQITNTGDGNNGDNSLTVTMELNGVKYEGVLFAQSQGRTPNSTNNNTKQTRSIVS